MKYHARILRKSDIGRCVDICLEPLVEFAGSPERAANRICTALDMNSLLAVVVCPADQPDHISAFGALVYVSDSLVRSLKEDKDASFLDWFMRDQDIEAELLTLVEQEVAHRQVTQSGNHVRSEEAKATPGQGVNLVGSFHGWESDDPALKEAIAESMKIDVCGLYVKSEYKQLYSEHLARSYAENFGLPIVRKSSGSFLVGMDRSTWESKQIEGRPLNRVFRVSRNIHELKPLERMVLQAFMFSPGSTARAIADRLEISEDSVKGYTKTLTSDIIKTHLCPLCRSKNPMGYEICKMCGKQAPIRKKSKTGYDVRGGQRWGEVIEYIQSNLQEIRPWVNMPEQHK